MWLISNHQLENISKSMRIEFENRVYFLLVKEKWCNENISEQEMKQMICRLTEYLIEYQITKESLAMMFIKLCFLSSIMMQEHFSKLIADIFMQAENENEKIEYFIIYLNENNYVSEF